MDNNLYSSVTYIQQLDYVIKRNNIFEKLKDKNILITGATGLICSAIVDLMLRNNELNNSKTNVYVACRNFDKARNRFSKYSDSPYLIFKYYDACQDNNMDGSYDYIIHGASNAYPAAISKEPVETMLSNIRGTAEILDIAKKVNVQNIIYISSSEIYGIKNNDNPYTEEEYGYIDVLNPRSSYPISKRAGETLCVSHSIEHGTHVNIVRPGHIYGPTASINDNRVSSQFAYSAVNGENLILKSSGLQKRSYCYVMDCATAILYVMLYGENRQAYNISNVNSIITIRQLAEYYAEYANVQVVYDIPTQQEKLAFNQMSNSSLNSDKIEKLGWKGLFDAEYGISTTIKILEEVINNK